MILPVRQIHLPLEEEGVFFAGLLDKKHIETISTCGLFKGIPVEKIEGILKELNVHIREYGKGELISLEGEFDKKQQLF